MALSERGEPFSCSRLSRSRVAGSLARATGSSLVAGDSVGGLTVFDIASDLAIPRRDEIARLEATVERLISASSEETA